MGTALVNQPNYASAIVSLSWKSDRVQQLTDSRTVTLSIVLALAFGSLGSLLGLDSNIYDLYKCSFSVPDWKSAVERQKDTSRRVQERQQMKELDIYSLTQHNRVIGPRIYTCYF